MMCKRAHYFSQFSVIPPVSEVCTHYLRNLTFPRFFDGKGEGESGSGSETGESGRTKLRGDPDGRHSYRERLANLLAEDARVTAKCCERIEEIMKRMRALAAASATQVGRA